MEPAVLSRDQAAHYSGISVSTLEKQVRNDAYPKPRQLSKGRVGWLRREIDEHLEALPVSDLPPGPGVAS